MLNILDLIPSKDIREHLKKIDYKVDMETAFYIVWTFAPNKKQKEYCQFIVDNYEDKEHTYPAINGKDIDKTYHYMIKKYMDSLDTKEGERDDEETPDWSLRFPYWTCDLPVPFKDGDVLHIPNDESSPILIRKLTDDDRARLNTDVVKLTDSFVDSYMYYQILDDGIIYESLMGYDDGMTNHSNYLNYEYYDGDFEGKYEILKELRDAYKNNELEKALSKYKVIRG